MKRILLMAANSEGTSRVRFDEEIREIREGLLRSKNRDQFQFHTCLAIRYDDLRREMLDYQPHIVHFIGHGEDTGVIVESKSGDSESVNTEALAGLFKLFSNHVGCVILDSCYSKHQAEAISKYISYVVGMRGKIRDKDAIAFTVAFYDALIAGESVEKSFRFGLNGIRYEYPDLPTYLIPLLKRKQHS